MLLVKHRDEAAIVEVNVGESREGAFVDEVGNLLIADSLRNKLVHIPAKNYRVIKHFRSSDVLLFPWMTKSWRREVEGCLPQTPTVVQPVAFSVCSHWKQNIAKYGEKYENHHKLDQEQSKDSLYTEKAGTWRI